MSVSARSRLTAGVFAAAAGIALVAPVAVPPTAVPSLTAIASPAIQLSAALTPLAPIAQIAQPVGSAASGAAAVGQTPGDWIINAYFTVQPWVEYGVEVFAWATEWLPWPIGLLAPQADIIYSGWQPFAESVAFALAYLVDGQFDLVLPTLTFGIQTGISTFIQNEIAWIASFFPPLPPIGFAAAAPVAAGVGAAAPTRAPALTGNVAQAEATTAATPETGIESVAAQTDTAEAAAVSAQADAENVPSAAAATASEALAEVTTAAPPEVTAAAPVEVAAAAPVEVTAAEPAVADVAPAPRAVRHSGRAPTQSPAVTSVREAPAAAAATAASSAADSAEPKSRVSARGGRAG